MYEWDTIRQGVSGGLQVRPMTIMLVAIVASSIFTALPGVGSAASPAPRRTDAPACLPVMPGTREGATLRLDRAPKAALGKPTGTGS